MLVSRTIKLDYLNGTQKFKSIFFNSTQCGSVAFCVLPIPTKFQDKKFVLLKVIVKEFIRKIACTLKSRVNPSSLIIS